MAGFAGGDIVLVPFPYIEQEIGGKIRPALVLAALPDDAPAPPSDQVLILCEITSHPPRDSNDIPLRAATDLVRGRITNDSTIRLSRIWTFADQRVQRRVAHITETKMREIVAQLHMLFSVPN